MKKPKHPAQEDALVKVQSREELAQQLNKYRKITGMTTETGLELIINQMMAMQVWHRSKTETQKLTAAVDLIAEFQPTNATEALLAVQMFGIHEAALFFLKRATLDGQTFEGNDANVVRATRLMRLFSEQAELMAKLKGKTAQQKVIVEHVHIHQGGQAIVGAVTATKQGRGVGDGEENR
jgi:hypothetical protein